MDIKEIRVKRLTAVIDKLGGAANDERDYDIIASYLSQLINGHRPFGEKSARNIELKLGLAAFYFDSVELNDMGYQLNNEMLAHIKVMQLLPDYARTEVMRDAIKTAELITKAQASANKNGTSQ